MTRPVDSPTGTRRHSSRLPISPVPCLIALALGVMALSLPAEALAQSRPASTPGMLTGQVRMSTTPMFTIQETKKQYIPPPLQGTLQKESQKSGHGVIGLDMLIFPDRYPIIQSVFPGTPAQRAGMLPGDTLVSVNGTQTIGKSRRQVDFMISDRPGDTVRFTVLRDGEMKSVQVTVAAIEDVSAALRRELSTIFGTSR